MLVRLDVAAKKGKPASGPSSTARGAFGGHHHSSTSSLAGDISLSRREAVPALVSAGLILTIANTLFTVATTMGLPEHRLDVDSLSAAVTTGLVKILLHERLNARQ